ADRLGVRIPAHLNTGAARGVGVYLGLARARSGEGRDVDPDALNRSPGRAFEQQARVLRIRSGRIAERMAARNRLTPRPHVGLGQLGARPREVPGVAPQFLV